MLKKKNIPLILFQSSFIDTINGLCLLRKLKNKIYYFAFNKFLNLPLTNRQRFWGNESKSAYKLLWSERFAENIDNKKTVRIVGNPSIERYFSIDKNKGEILKSQLHIGNKVVITICTEGFNNLINENEVNDLYKSSIINNPGKHFLIKVHPREDIKYYQDYFVGQNITILKDYDLLDLYSFTDVQISVNSYSSFEAVLCGIPVILVKRDLIKLQNYFSDNVVIYADTEDKLNDAIRTALSEKYISVFNVRRKKFIEKLFCESEPDVIKRKIINSFEQILSSLNA